MFFAIASPYFIYYSAYMKLILFSESYESHKFNKISCFGKIFLILNLTCVGSFFFVIFDIMSKVLAIFIILSLPMGARGHEFVRDKYDSLMLKVFKLNQQDLKAFETQKKVAIPMFEDVPMLLVQLFIKYHLHPDD